jgi:hypothetical protein
MDLRRHPGPLRAEQKHVVGAEAHPRQGLRAGGGQQDHASAPLCAERGPVGVPLDRDMAGIVHRRPALGPLTPGEAHGFDQVDPHPQTRPEPQDRADIAGDVGLVEGDAHVSSITGVVTPAKGSWQSRGPAFNGRRSSAASAGLRGRSPAYDMLEG